MLTKRANRIPAHHYYLSLNVDHSLFGQISIYQFTSFLSKLRGKDFIVHGGELNSLPPLSSLTYSILFEFLFLTNH